MHRVLARLIAFLVCAVLTVAISAAETFDRLVDTNATIPGTNVKFDAVGGAAWMNKGVAFTGSPKTKRSSQLGAQGLYIRDASGALRRVADSTTSIPGRSIKFDHFRHPACVGDWVYFTGGTFAHQGVFRFDGKSLTVVAERDMPAPGIAEKKWAAPPKQRVPLQRVTFAAFDPPVACDSGVMFMAMLSDAPSYAIYIDRSATGRAGLEKLISADQLGRNRSSGIIIPLDLDQKQLLFQSNDAVYLLVGGKVTAFSDLSIDVPEAQKPVIRARDGRLHKGQLIVAASSVDENAPKWSGILKRENDRWIPIATSGTAHPNGPQFSFRSFQGLIPSDHGVVFRAFHAEKQSGVYLAANGRVSKIISAGDTVDTKTVAASEASDIRSDRLLLNIGFTDGTSGIYATTLKSPGLTTRPVSSLPASHR